MGVGVGVGTGVGVGVGLGVGVGVSFTRNWKIPPFFCPSVLWMGAVLSGVLPPEKI